MRTFVNTARPAISFFKLRLRTAAWAIAACAPLLISSSAAHAQALLASSLHHNTVERISMTGVVTNVAPALNPGPGHLNPNSVYDAAVDRYGNVYYGISAQNVIIKIDKNGNQSTFAIAPNPAGLAIGPDGCVYISSDTGGSVIKITPAGVQTVLATGLQNPYGIIVDKDGTIYTACEGEGPGKGIYKITRQGVVSFLAAINHPARLAFDSHDTLYASDWLAGGIYSISSSGSISAYVTGFKDPLGIAFDTADNLYVAETPSEWGGSGSGPERIVKVQAGSKAQSTLTYNVSGIDGLKFTAENYITDTPEPGVSALLISGCLALIVSRRNRRSARAH